MNIEYLIDKGFLICNEAHTIEDLLYEVNCNIDLEEDKIKSVKELYESFIIIKENDKFYRFG